MEELTEPSLREPMARRAPGWVAWKNDERYADDLARFARDLMAGPRRRTRHRLACSAVGRLLARAWRDR
jgi:hypothetical protein